MEHAGSGSSSANHAVSTDRGRAPEACAPGTSSARARSARVRQENGPEDRHDRNA